MKIETISRILNSYTTISKSNNYYIDNTMHGTVNVVDDLIFSYNIEISSDNIYSGNDRATLCIDCAKYNIHVVYEFFQYHQTVGSIADCIISVLINTKKMLLNVANNT